MFDSIIPIQDFAQPKEGKRSLQYTVDLSASLNAVIDLVSIMMQKQVSQLPTMFFDNADNDFAITFVMEGTLQRFVAPPNSQGYVRLLLPQKGRLGVSAPSNCVVKVNFLNWPVEELTIWRVESAMSGGTVTSVGLTAPAEFTVTGSPVTTAGTLTLAWANELANKVFAAPNGVAGTPSFRSLVAADIPALNYVTSVGLALPAEFNVTGSPVTGAGTLTGAWANQTANKVFAGPGSGGAATPAFRALVAADIPATLNTFNMTAGATITPDQVGGIVGTNTNNNAQAGSVGEYSILTRNSGSALPATSSVALNVETLVLTPGDWDVTGNVAFISTAALLVWIGGIGLVSATLPPDEQINSINLTTSASGSTQRITCPTVRVSVSVNTNVYLIGQCAFSSGSCNVWGSIRARRVR